MFDKQLVQQKGLLTILKLAITELFAGFRNTEIVIIAGYIIIIESKWCFRPPDEHQTPLFFYLSLFLLLIPEDMGKISGSAQ